MLMIVDTAVALGGAGRGSGCSLLPFFATGEEGFLIVRFWFSSCCFCCCVLGAAAEHKFAGSLRGTAQRTDCLINSDKY